MNDGQQKDFDFLFDNGATWPQAMDWCITRRLGYSRIPDLCAWLAALRGDA